MKRETEKIDEEKKKGFTRREFIKDAGIIVGGAAIGSVTFAGACTTTKTTTVTLPPITKQAETTTLQPSTVTTTVTPPTTTIAAQVPPAIGHIVNDPNLCRGCHRCELACSIYHEGVSSEALSRIHINEDGLNLDFSAVTCSQCNSPSCYFACPLKDVALCIDSTTGARYINQDKCIGCGLCVQACPLPVPPIWSKPASNALGKVFFKCDLCKDRKVATVLGITLTNPGSGYTSTPTVAFSGGGGSGAMAFAKIGSAVTSVNITAGGSGYTSAPTIGVSGGGGSGATATSTIGSGTVTGLTLTNPGASYTSPPNITISGGGGSGATATAKISGGQLCVETCDHRNALSLAKRSV